MSILIFAPHHDDPTPGAPLMLLDCPECADEPRTDCRTCYGAGDYEVCSRCLERPWVVCGVEQCQCSLPGLHAPRCEYVGDDLSACTAPAEVDGLCGGHWRQGLETVVAEDDPCYRAWVQAQLEFGEAAGWLEAGEAA